DPLIEQRPLQLLRKQSLPADLTERSRRNIALRNNRHQFDDRAPFLELSQNPFRLPARQSAAARAQAECLSGVCHARRLKGYSYDNLYLTSFTIAIPPKPHEWSCTSA